ncbi:hypothetical protein WR25_25509 [Diploscapter pachys]|uniref:Bicarbonate transporter-like transmembrane domain-containing protein n=1 Tax=Diploscapter pachys TaxID=2018661 RepID=A0A2A2LD96_9BILA|nr:hypothetical protein WR25_25509 [Diploscapter pachys]
MSLNTGTLLICAEEACRPRNLSEEIRAKLDAKSLIDSAVILHNLIDTNMIHIIDKLLDGVEKENAKIDKDSVKKELFSINNDENMGIRFRKKVQQYCKTDFYDINQCWIVLFAEIDNITKRHIALATLKEATNMGDEAQEMQIIALVIAPKIDKETKSAKETAQTIATLLTRDELRLRIEECQTSDEIRNLLKQEAEWHLSKKETRIEIGPDDDNSEGVKDSRTISKVISTAVFLIFTILPTSISYGILNDDNTHGSINVQKVILGQAIGGVVFGLFGGQQLLILSTTAPLSIYISVIYAVCKANDWDFFEMYAAVGIYAQLFLILFALFQMANLMKYTMRSTEEIFGLFIAAALTYKAIMATIKTYITSYAACATTNITNVSLRMEGENFPIYSTPDAHWIPFYNLPGAAHGPAVGLAFPLSLLFFMDQLLVTNTIDNKQHNLAKGSSHHWDLLVVAILNIFLSIVGLPWMHGALPSAFLHLKALSDVEERLHNGRVQQVIVRVRETRLAVLLAHVLMFPIYFYLIPYLNQFIPIALFHGKI